MKPAEEIVVTGLGPVSCAGIGRRFFASNGPVSAGTNAATGFRGVENFDLNEYVTVKTQCLDRVSAMALVAAKLAIDDAGWVDEPDRSRLGLILGTTRGNMSVMQDYLKLTTASPLRFVHTFINTPAGLTSQVLKLQGVHTLLCSGAVAGLQAIRYGCYLLVAGKADKIICGGVDSFAVSPSPAESGVAVDGAVAGEGAGLIGVQKADHVVPGQRVYGRILGAAVQSGRELDAGHCYAAMYNAVTGTGVAFNDLDQVVLATHRHHRYAAAERRALKEAGVRPERWTALAEAIGHTGAAHGGLAVISACNGGHDSSQSDSCFVLVNAYQPGQVMAMLLNVYPEKGASL